ncbi:CobW domain-containing protein [Aulographum hederae CBS 113979]|uniref:CobW domain-containing protein n=1 Tax=Aulographum hederae CBS 113979 TaxID=1176131 RepID=A0A6G1GUM3_9PEZI|nr:CobW domain-containing protein [Aulographum hederae CBS 113979]
MPPIPITIITGFLGSGKTTLILNLIPQLPSNYKLALLKNEFGDLAIDSQLATSSSISGVQELLNGCICCNLVGQLGEALETLKNDVNPDRIIIETSGSAFPATLAMEVNRLGAETGNFTLDGVVSIIDVENWTGYKDTSVTAKLQAKYTDLIVLNKWEHVPERTLDDCIDRILDLELDIQTPRVKSRKGKVDMGLVLGLDAKLARRDAEREADAEEEHKHDHGDDGHHQEAEVEVLSVTLQIPGRSRGVDLDKLEEMLFQAPKDELYRIKAVVYASAIPTSSSGDKAAYSGDAAPGEGLKRYILNWAFGRWTYTAVSLVEEKGDHVLKMTIMAAPYESAKWKKRVESGDLVKLEGGDTDGILTVETVS